MNQSESNHTEALGSSAKPAAGSTLYYCLLNSESTAQQRAFNTLRLIQTISTTLFDVNEPQVAEKKIHWWHEELSRLAAQTARHPACVAVQDHQHTQSSLNACLNILSAGASERYNPLTTEQALREHIVADYRARITLFEHALSAHPLPTQHEQPIHFQPKDSNNNDSDDTDNLSVRDAMALGLGYSHRLNSLATRMHSGYSVFSDELYQQFGVTPEKLRDDNDARPIMDYAIAQANDALRDAIGLSNQHKSQPAAHLALVIMCHIRQAQMQLWQKKQPNLTTESMALTPVRKFIIAYRCKRRYVKRG